ncbi:conserved hypothetical protein [Uncinocarpus reesii 1704]|uniref:YAG7-like dimerisation domain-containing protein n=1 Tax=Uncinocarpus reesii (strain UAMH 1704) TaxID=336963 RepID=C4JPZ9_UNCRE|nr:uncharacterized protein UREG_03232 [Uncinocarpus reesii 1704]EEP78386.1 conserved hypothetical protein [Uncinocarpus reesii 1704]
MHRQPIPKGSKKKRGKTEAPAAPSTPAPQESTSTAEPTANGASYEFPFVKELQKSLRNATKKLNATAKVDAIVAENPGKSLDDLVAAKKINADQKAQILKKPGLQETVASIEEQLLQFKQYGAYYDDRLAKQKDELDKAHKEELESIKQSIVAETMQAAEQDFKERLLVLSKFLRAAAAMRRSGDETSNDSRAFEGSLFQVYGGSEEAVDAMTKLINGADEKVPSVEGDLLEVAYSRVKQASLDYMPPSETWTEEAQQPAESTPTAETLPASDPTITNAGMTELRDQSLAEQASTTNGFAPPTSHPAETVPAQTVVTDGSANPMAQAAWDPQPDLTKTQVTEQWVNAEAEKAAEIPASTQEGPRPPLDSTNRWADDVPVTQATPAEGPRQGDGFERVFHHTRQNSGRGRGSFRGNRGANPHRGRGGQFRGDRGDFRGRGRGRGEFRGGRGRGSFHHPGGEATPAQ